MERFKRICRMLLFPHWLIVLLVAAASAAGLGYVFLTGRELSWMAYPIYVLSAYALTVLCIWLVPIAIRKAKEPPKVLTQAQREAAFRKSLRSGAAMNLVYALFHMAMGAVTRSPWTGSQGAYQLVTALIHLVLMGYERKMAKEEDAGAKALVGWKGFQACGVWLLILHLTMTGLVFQMVWYREAENYPGVMIFAVAAYTFYKLTRAVIRVVQYRKNASPLWGASRNIDLSEAMMNLFTLQAALLSVFGTAEQEGFRFLMNSLVGGAVCLLAVGGAVGMIGHGNMKMKNIAGEN